MGQPWYSGCYNRILQTEWLLPQKCVLTVLEAGKCKIKMPADSVPGETLSGQTAVLSGALLVERGSKHCRFF